MPDAQGAGGPLLSRRTLLGSAAAITAAGALGARPGRAEAATGLLRIVDLGQGATLHPGSPADLRVGDNRALLAESGTAAVRLWADWPSLQPDPAARARRPREPRRAVPRGARRPDRGGQRGRPARRPAVLPLPHLGERDRRARRGARDGRRDLLRLRGPHRARGLGAVRGRGSRPGGLHALAAGARVRRPGRGLRSRHRVGGDVRVPARALPARHGRPVRRRDRARQRAQLPALAPARAVADRRPVRARPGRRAAHRRRDDGLRPCRVGGRGASRAAADAVVRGQQPGRPDGDALRRAHGRAARRAGRDRRRRRRQRGVGAPRLHRRRGSRRGDEDPAPADAAGGPLDRARRRDRPGRAHHGGRRAAQPDARAVPDRGPARGAGREHPAGPRAPCARRRARRRRVDVRAVHAARRSELRLRPARRLAVDDAPPVVRGVVGGAARRRLAVAAGRELPGEQRDRRPRPARARALRRRAAGDHRRATSRASSASLARPPTGT